MNRPLAVLAISALLGAAAHAADDRTGTRARAALIYDAASIDPCQYCVHDGKLYTRGIALKTGTGVYLCRLPDTGAPDYLRIDVSRLAWIRQPD